MADARHFVSCVAADVAVHETDFAFWVSGGVNKKNAVDNNEEQQDPASFADMPEIPERRMMSQAGDNITLDCPGVTDMSLVLQLEWWANDMKLVQYSDAGTTVWENRRRITLRKDNYALEIHPVSAEDNGRYTCLVNSRPRPEAYIMLQVQGKSTL
ncbi:uncharacterized protein LOC124722243 [Schistocerca piceifrons]|uniref:uncharacterized protein LOC124722243 n=1 Tax=Schistocerca piceifrons TaxID=274613 RepID=UPI001F5F2D38|nr:uncharacterized protein LOC124722243 [Schistocerca piceifrons]